MNAKTLARVNRFGKVGKIVTTILMILAILITLLSGITTISAATFPKDAITVSMTNHAEFSVDQSSYLDAWSMLVDSFTSTVESSDGILMDSDNALLPPENTQLQTEMNFFNHSYSSAMVRSEGSKKIIEASSDPVEYRSSDLVMVLVFTTLLLLSEVVSLLMLRKLFKVLSLCESPFCTEFVSKLRSFGYSLLPVTVFASVGETLAIRFMSAGRTSGITIQWGLLLTFAVTMGLVTVFRYGVQLQKESDETL